MSEKELPASKSDPDGPPSYDETDTPPPPDFKPDSKSRSTFPSDSKGSLEPTESSSSSQTYSGIIPQPSILALEDAPPKYATITIHSWNQLRFVNFPQSVLEAVDAVAKVYYLNGIRWEFEYGQWKMNTNARAFTNADGTAGRYLLLAIFTRLSQFGYTPQSTLLANSPALLDKDTYFFKRSPTPLPPLPSSTIRGLSSVTSPSPSPSTPKAGFGSILSKLILGSDKEKERTLPDIGVIQSFDQSRYNLGKRYFCLSIWRSDRMTILGCPDDTVLDGLTKAIIVRPEGIESVTSSDPYGWKWKFKGKPWSTRASETLTHSKLLLCSVLDELDSRGWECVLTTRFTRDEEWRDSDTWYFASQT